MAGSQTEMEVQLTLDKNDWVRYQHHIKGILGQRAKNRASGFWADLLINVVLLSFFVLVVIPYLVPDTGLHRPTVISLFSIIAAGILWRYFKNRQIDMPAEQGLFYRQRRFHFSETGVRIEGRGFNCCYSWSVIQSIEHTEGMILLWLDTADALLLPDTRLTNPEALFNHISLEYNKSHSAADKNISRGMA